jgi:hypothetical protein
MLEQAFILQPASANLESPAPGANLIFFKEVTFDGNGQAVADISNYKLPPLTKIYWAPMYQCGAYPRVNGISPATAGEFGTADIEITSWQVGLSLSAVAADGDVPAVVVPAASKTILCMFIIDAGMVHKGAM